MAQAMDPEMLAKTPAGKPPPGIVPNLVNPHSNGPELIAVGAVLVALMLVFVAVRIYTKIKIAKRATPDDYTCLGAAIGAVVYFIMDIFAVTVGHFGTHMWDLSLADVTGNGFLITGFLTNWSYFLFLSLAKSTFFLLYIQLFRPMKWLRYSCYAGLAFTIAFYLGIIIFTLVFTAPAPGESWLDASQRPGSEVTLRATTGIACVGMVLDLYILILPIAGVQKLQLSPRRKLAVMSVFMMGGMACIASALAIYFKWRLDYRDTADVTYATMPILLTGLVEICVGVIASCMPSVSSLLRHQPNSWTKLSSLFASAFRSQGYSSSRDKRSGDSDQSNSLKPKPKRARYADLEDGSNASYEMDLAPPAKSMQSYVRTGRPGEVSEDGIHLQYDVEQQTSMSRRDDTYQ